MRFDGTQSAVLADVDGDLDLDLLLGDQQESTILLLNEGNGFYQDAAMSQLPRSLDNTQAVLAVDVDRDTDLDIIEVNLFGPDRLLLNDGFGIFTVDTSFPLDSDGTYGVAAGDIDGDRWVDLLFLNGLGRTGSTATWGTGSCRRVEPPSAKHECVLWWRDGGRRRRRRSGPLDRQLLRAGRASDQ